MTLENIQFIKEQSTHNRPDIQRLLALLIESEAMREKEKFLGSHSDIALSNGCNCCKKHYWTDFDWIAAKKKEILG